MTAIEWLAKEVNADCLNSTFIQQKLIEQARDMERQQLFDAMMYALDEDGHTGDWKVKFINDYIDKL